MLEAYFTVSQAELSPLSLCPFSAPRRPSYSHQEALYAQRNPYHRQARWTGPAWTCAPSCGASCMSGGWATAGPWTPWPPACCRSLWDRPPGRWSLPRTSREGICGRAAAGPHHRHPGHHRPGAGELPGQPWTAAERGGGAAPVYRAHCSRSRPCTPPSRSAGRSSTSWPGRARRWSASPGPSPSTPWRLLEQSSPQADYILRVPLLQGDLCPDPVPRHRPGSGLRRRV